MSKIILDLCGGTGSWSKPYKDAGYDVRLITLPDMDILKWRNYPDVAIPLAENEVYGILAAPPCTMFSHARTIAKKPRDLVRAMDIVRAVLEIVSQAQYRTPTGAKTTNLKFWALENPHKGLLPRFLGNPPYIFEPWEFGDQYTKQTALWGYFNKPVKTEVTKPLTVKFDKLKSKEIHGEFYGRYTRTERRAITPAGFAKAFMEANS